MRLKKLCYRTEHKEDREDIKNTVPKAQICGAN